MLNKRVRRTVDDSCWAVALPIWEGGRKVRTP